MSRWAVKKKKKVKTIHGELKLKRRKLCAFGDVFFLYTNWTSRAKGDYFDVD